MFSYITAQFDCSYDRLQSDKWGAYLLWGNENREAPLRASSPPGTPSGLVSNFELKLLDGTANPYLALAATIAAGIDGLRRHLSLTEPVGKIIKILYTLKNKATVLSILFLLFHIPFVDLHDGCIILFGSYNFSICKIIPNIISSVISISI